MTAKEMFEKLNWSILPWDGAVDDYLEFCNEVGKCQDT